jgi:queuine tRNA-ribosyltransferase
MGVGKPDDIVGAVARDRHDGLRAALALGPDGAGLHPARRGQHQERPRTPTIRGRWTRIAPVPACRGYSRAYLHHVFRSGEIIASMLLTWHNLHYYQELMAGMRAAIAEDRFAQFEAAFPRRPGVGDIEPI